MSVFKRESYVNQLVEAKHNGMIKIVTGLRRSGKSYLLFTLFKQHLIDAGVDKQHIIEIILDDLDSEQLRDINACWQYIKSNITDDEMYYVLIDEVQLMDNFEQLLNTLLHHQNIDVYVTGSNSRLLSSDIATEFRGRGDEIHLYPLSISEIAETYPERDFDELLQEYMLYGGLPMTVQQQKEQRKRKYLKELYRTTYLKDIVERYKIKNTELLDKLVSIIASSVGSLTNANKLRNTFLSVEQIGVSDTTINQYLTYLEDAFLTSKAQRYDIKGRNYIGSPYKYYFTDIGLRNVRLNFRQLEETHLMENIIYMELLRRGYEVDVGMLEIVEKDEAGKQQHKRIEIDFVVNQGFERYYIQSAYALPSVEKRQQEERPLLQVKDGFRKIIITHEPTPLRQTENGIVVMSLKYFLLNNDSLKS